MIVVMSAFTHAHAHTHAQPQLPCALKDVLIKLQLCPAAAGPRDIARGLHRGRERDAGREREKGRSKQGSLAAGWWWGTDGGLVCWGRRRRVGEGGRGGCPSVSR